MGAGSKKGTKRGGIAVIGYGDWGTSLAYAVRRSEKLDLREVIVRKGARELRGWEEADLDAEILWICVGDSEIAGMPERILARRPGLRGQIVVHSSGVLPAEVLGRLRGAGAKIASVHPAMSFPTRRPVTLKGVLFGMESDDAGALRRLESIVRDLGGKPFMIRPGAKSLYHAAGTLASPLLVSLMSVAGKTAELSGLAASDASKVVGALAGATLTNVLRQGLSASFSGPFARGDVATIRLHLQALQSHPVLADAYRALAANAAEQLPVKRRSAVKALLRQESGETEPGADEL